MANIFHDMDVHISAKKLIDGSESLLWLNGAVIIGEKPLPGGWSAIARPAAYQSTARSASTFEQ